MDTNGFGQSENNDIGFGSIYQNSWSGEVEISNNQNK